MKLLQYSLLLLFPVLTYSYLSQKKEDPVKRTVKETLLAKLEGSNMLNTSFTFPNNMKNLAFVTRYGKKQIVMIHGYQGRAHDTVLSPIFGPDGNSFVYRVKDSSNWTWINNKNEELKARPNAVIEMVYYSPDNKNIALLQSTKNKFFVVYKGVTGRYYDAIDLNSVIFSADGKKIAYTATKDQKEFNVYDDHEGPAFNKVGYPVLSNDGKHIAYWAKKDNRAYAVKDGIYNKAFDDVNTIIFSRDGNHFAYQAKIDGMQVVVADTATSEKYVTVHSVCFSPDGSRLAYGLSKSIPDKEGFNEYLSLDCKLSQAYETVVEGSLKFSPDGYALAFEAEIHDFFFITSRGKQGKHYGDVLQTTITYSPDNRHLAYAAELDGKRFVISDDQESKAFQDIYNISFSPDSKRLAFSAKQDGKELVVVDNMTGNLYDAILGQGSVFFDSPNSFHYIALKGDEILLVEEIIETVK